MDPLFKEELVLPFLSFSSQNKRSEACMATLFTTSGDCFSFFLIPSNIQFLLLILFVSKSMCPNTPSTSPLVVSDFVSTLLFISMPFDKLLLSCLPAAISVNIISRSYCIVQTDSTHMHTLIYQYICICFVCL